VDSVDSLEEELEILVKKIAGGRKGINLRDFIKDQFQGGINNYESYYFGGGIWNEALSVDEEYTKSIA
jgi:hypothetical protein